MLLQLDRCALDPCALRQVLELGRNLRLHPGPCSALQLDQACPCTGVVDLGLQFVSRKLMAAFPGTIAAFRC